MVGESELVLKRLEQLKEVYLIDGEYREGNDWREANWRKGFVCLKFRNRQGNLCSTGATTLEALESLIPKLHPRIPE